MAQFVTLQQAACNALATWLTTELADVTGTLVVEPRWFSADRLLPEKAISIVFAGPRRIEWTQAEALVTSVVAVDPGEDPTVDVTWMLGHAMQPLQLDVWARTDVELDDLIARLDTALNKGASGLSIANVDPVAPGLLLALGDGWTPGTADFSFEEPQTQHTASSANEGEWRATYRGRANALLVQAARSPLLARVLLDQRLRETDPVDTEAPYETTELSPSD